MHKEQAHWFQNSEYINMASSVFNTNNISFHASFYTWPHQTWPPRPAQFVRASLLNAKSMRITKAGDSVCRRGKHIHFDLPELRGTPKVAAWGQQTHHWITTGSSCNNRITGTSSRAVGPKRAVK